MDFQEIRIENTNVCGYHCQMCPREKHTRPLGFMSVKNFQLVLDRLDFPFEKDLHMHGYGEPLLDNFLIEKIRMAREKWPKAYIAIYSTLGVPLQEWFFQELIDAGLNHICVSCYGFTRNSYKAVHGVDNFDLFLSNLKKLHEVKKTCKIKLITATKKMFSKLSLQPDFSKEIAKYVDSIKKFNLHNYGDGRAYNKAKEIHCFRICPLSILQITWDLNVIPCCYDYNSSIPLGNLHQETLPEIFSGKKYQDLLSAHFFSDFENYPICQNCEKL